MYKGYLHWVSLVLDFLADGVTEADLLAEYPQLIHEDVLAAIGYGAEATRGRKAVPHLLGRGPSARDPRS